MFYLLCNIDSISWKQSIASYWVNITIIHPRDLVFPLLKPMGRHIPQVDNYDAWEGGDNCMISAFPLNVVVFTSILAKGHSILRNKIQMYYKCCVCPKLEHVLQQILGTPFSVAFHFQKEYMCPSVSHIKQCQEVTAFTNAVSV